MVMHTGRRHFGALPAVVVEMVEFVVEMQWGGLDILDIRQRNTTTTWPLGTTTQQPQPQGRAEEAHVGHGCTANVMMTVVPLVRAMPELGPCSDAELIVSNSGGEARRHGLCPAVRCNSPLI
jgi:hypothetical protein